MALSLCVRERATFFFSFQFPVFCSSLWATFVVSFFRSKKIGFELFKVLSVWSTENWKNTCFDCPFFFVIFTFSILNMFFLLPFSIVVFAF